MVASLPAQTNRVHLKQSNPFCDTVAVLHLARLHRRGQRWADMNTVMCADGFVNLHWVQGPKLNGFTHIVEDGKRRSMRADELHRPVIKWNLKDVKRWRKRVAGRWIRPYSILERQRQAKVIGVAIAWELKSNEFGMVAYRDRAAEFVRQMHLAGGRWAVMTLVTMHHWQTKMRYFHQAGAQTALLAHGAPKPGNFNAYAPYIDRVWGQWSR